MSDPKKFELRSFDEEVQVQQDLQRARDEIKAAEADRDRVRELARREGLELGMQDAREQAAAEERGRVARETAGLAGLLRAAAEGIEARREALAAAAERDLLVLALAVAEKIVKVEVASGRRIAPENLRRAVELTARRQEIRVLVHPEDLLMIEEFLPDLRRQFADLRDVDLEPNAAVGRGGVLVQTREGSVDATVASQLAEIERGLLG